MSNIIKSLKNTLSPSKTEEEDRFSYFWDDVEREASVAEVSVESVRSTLSHNRTEIFLFLTLLLALTSLFLNLQGELYLIFISALLCISISLALMALNGEYREPKRKMDHAIEKMIRLDFSENPEFIYMDALPPELERIEKIRSKLASQQEDLKNTINSILNRSASSQLNMNLLIKDVNKVSTNIERTITGSTNFQETRLYATTVSQDIDHFTQVFDTALAINEDVALAIKTIGKQINMLALNAGIEAARAGEHGIGFEVVSANLQQLSQHAVRTTSEMKANRSSISQNASGTLSSITQSMNSLVDNIDRSNQIFSNLSSQVFDIRQRLNDLSADLNGLISEVNSLTEISQRRSLED